MSEQITNSKLPAIFAALTQVAQAMRERGVGKNKTNMGGGRYKYRSIDDVYAALSPALADACVFIAPEKVKTEVDARAERQRFVRLHVQYCATCAKDGSQFRFEGMGEGFDMNDKAVGKALSYAYKTAMFTLFCIPVEGQDDTDSQTINEPIPTQKQAVQRPPATEEQKLPNIPLTPELEAKAKEAAQSGMIGYKNFFGTLSKQDKWALIQSGKQEENKRLAAQIDYEFSGADIANDQF